MSLDLNGSSISGTNYVTSYIDDTVAIGIVGSGVVVGNGSSSANTDGIDKIRLRMSAQSGDYLQISTLPSGLVLSGPGITSGATSWSGPVIGDVYIQRSSPFVTATDVMWQNALKGVTFYNSTPQTGPAGFTPPVRSILVDAYDGLGTLIYGATTTINIDNAPWAQADTGEAIEAGGLNNGTAGSNATKTAQTGVLANDYDSDPGDVKTVSAVAIGGASGVVGNALAGAYGSLVLNADGSYTYTVNNANAAVQALGVGQTLTDTFTYTMRDQADATSSTTLTITVQGADDAPGTISLGHWFNGTAGAVVSTAQLLDAYSDFTLEFKVTPTETITLHSESNTGAAGLSGQHYAIAALQGQTTWGSSSHAGIGVSVGTNGITVYQHTANVLSPLLTWGGTVSPETRVAVVFDDNQPKLYVNGTLVRTGLTSTIPNLHPSLTLGGDAYGYFKGTLSDYHVWDSALSVAQIGAHLTQGVSRFDPDLMVMPMLATSVAEPEQPYGFTVIGSAHAVDPEGHVITYSLQNNAGGRFLINATTGEISVASGAQFDYEANSYHDLVVRASANGSYTQSTLRVGVANLVEPPVAVADVGTATEAGTQAGSSAQGNVLLNDVAMEADGVKTVIAVGDSEGWSDGYVGQPKQGMYGTLTLDADGDYEYVLDNNNPAVQALRAGQTLSETFRYRVRGANTSTWAESTLTLTIQGTDDAPVAHADFATAREAGGVNNGTPGFEAQGNVLADDWDGDAGDTATLAVSGVYRYILVNGEEQIVATGTVGTALVGQYGSLLLNADGSYTYTVDNNNPAVQAMRTTQYSLGESFRYTVIDSSGNTASASLLIQIAGHNDAPIAVADVATAVEAGGVNNGTPGVDPTGNVLLNSDIDVDDFDLLTVSAFAHGSATAGPGSALAGAYGSLVLNSNGSYTYTVDNSSATVQALRSSAQTLTDTFTYTIRDIDGLESTSTLTVTIQGANDAPVAMADTIHVTEAGGTNNAIAGVPSGSINRYLNDTDVDAGDTRASSWSGNNSPYGSAGAFVGGGFSFTVNNNNAAVQALRNYDDTLTASYTYWLTDAAGAGSAATVDVVIHGANDAPSSSSLGTWFDGTAGSVVDPQQNLGAYDNFTLEFKVTATETIVLHAQSTSGGAGTSGQHHAIYPQQGQITWGSNAHVGIGVSVGTNGISVYQHTAFVAAPLLTWAVPAGTTLGAETQVAVVFNDKTPTLYINGTAVHTGLQSTAPYVHPSTVVGGGQWGNFKGGVSDYHVWDSALSSTQINANLSRGLTGTEPGLISSQLSTSVVENAAAGTVVGTAHTWDVDAGDTFTYSLVNNAGGRFAVNSTTGVITVAGGAPIDYDTASSHDVVVRATDAAGLHQDQTFRIRVVNLNEAPVAVDDEIDATRGGIGDYPDVYGTRGNLLTNDTDVDVGDTRTLVGLKAAGQASFNQLNGGLAAQLGQYGTIQVGPNGWYEYAAYSSQSGTAVAAAARAVAALREGETLADSFEYQIRDADGLISTATIAVTIHGANDAPVAVDDAGVATSSGTVEQGGANVFVAGTNPSGNVLTNDDPVDAGDWHYVTIPNTVLFSDGIGGRTYYEIDSAYGSLRLYQDGEYSYTLDNDNAAVRALRDASTTLVDSIDYFVSDAAGVTSPARLNITVQGANDTPVAVADNGDAKSSGFVQLAGVHTPYSGTIATGNVLGNDTDVDSGDTKTVSAVSFGSTHGTVGSALAGQYGSLVLDAAGNYWYTIDNGHPTVRALRTDAQTLTDTFSYRMRDAAGTWSTSTLTVTIHGTNDEPVAVADTAATAFQASGNVLANDTDVDAGDLKEMVVDPNWISLYDLTSGRYYQLIDGAYGTLRLYDDGEYLYTADVASAVVRALRTAGDTLVDNFTYHMRDAAGVVRSASLAITVQGVNEAPVATGGSATMVEDHSVKLDIAVAAPIDLGNGPVPAVTINALPPASRGTLLLNGQPVTAGQVIAAAELEALLFKPRVFTAAAFGYTDLDGGDAIQAVRIDTLPSAADGVLTLNGQALTAGQVIPLTSLADLSFDSTDNFHGTTTFTYSVQDLAGSFSATPAVFSLEVTSVNDTPTIEPLLGLEVHGGQATRLTNLHFSDPDVADAPVTVTLRVSAGTLIAQGTQDVQVAGDGTDTVTLTGRIDDINAFVSNASGGVSHVAPAHEPPAITVTAQRVGGDPSANPVVRIVMSSEVGSFNAESGHGVQVSNSGSNSITLVGLASDVNAFVNDDRRVEYQAPRQIVDMHVSIDDGGSTGADPGLTGGPGNETSSRLVQLNVVSPDAVLNAPLMADNEYGVPIAALAGLAVGAPLVLAMGGGGGGAAGGGTAGGGGSVAGMGWFHRIFGGGDDDYGRMYDDEREWPRRPDGYNPILTPLGKALEGKGWVVLLAGGLTVVAIIGVLVSIFELLDDPEAPPPPVNDTPDIGGPASITVYQDQLTELSGLTFSDAQNMGVEVTLSVPDDSGWFTALDGMGVLVTGNGTNELVLSGRPAAITDYIAAGLVGFTTAEHATGHVEMKVNINDLGHGGVDPGTTGDAHDEQADRSVQLNIQRVNNAPTSANADVTLPEQSVYTFTLNDFQFQDVAWEGDHLSFVKITSLPDSGKLMHNGVEVVLVNGAPHSVSQDDISHGLLTFVPANHGNSRDSTNFTFQVQDNGGTVEVDDGGTIGADTSGTYTVSLHVDHAPRLQTANATAFVEGEPAPTFLVADAVITEVDASIANIASVSLTVLQPRLGDTWAVDLVRFADAYQAHHPGHTVPTINIATTGNDSTLTFAGGAVSPAAAQALIESLVFRNDSVNVDEGTRQFTVQLVDEHGLASNTSTASVEVVSIFGSLERALAAELQSIAGHISQTGVPVASFEAQQQQDLVQWLAYRGQLADAVWNVLSKAPSSDGLIETGGSLIAALGALRVHYQKVELSPTPSAIAYVAQHDELIAINPGHGGAYLSPATRVALLKQLAAIRDESAQQWYFELAHALLTATEAGINAWQAENAAWTVAWLHDLGLLDAPVVQSADPEAHLAQNPSALVQDAAGNLWASKDTLKQLVTALDAHRINNLAKNSSYVELAEYLLAHGSAVDSVWAVDMSVLHWLNAAGIEHEAVTELAANADPLVALSEAGSLGSRDGKLLMSPATLDALTQALATATESSQSATAASELSALLAAMSAASGPYTLSNDQVHLLEEAGVRFRSVTELTSSSRVGDIAQADPNAAATFTAQTRAALLAQLEAIEASANAVPANVMALSSVVEVLEDLERATGTTFYGRALKEVAVSDELLAALQSQGLQIDDVSGFSTPERDLILPARLHMIGDAPRVYRTGDTLLVPADTVEALLRGFAQDLQFLGLDLGTAAVPEDSDSPQLSTDHAVQPPGMQAPTLNKAWLLQETADALDEIVESSTQVSFTTTSSLAFQARLFEVDAVDFKSLLASAGIALIDLGDVSRLNATQIAALQNAAEPAMGRDADGSLVLSQATAEALQVHLTAQYFRERADLAQAALGVLLQGDSEAQLTVVQTDGSLDNTLASALGGGLIVVSDRVLNTLAQLGVSVLDLHARTSQPTAADIAALATDGRFLLDGANHTLVMSVQTHAALLLQVAAQMRASQIAHYTNDPAAIDDARYDTPTEMAFNLLDAATVDSALTAAAQQTGTVVELAVTSDMLGRLRLNVFDAGRFDGSAEAQQALSLSARGTVQTDQDGHLWMSTATLDWLKLQFDAVQHPSAMPFDPSTAGTRVAQLDHLLDQVRDSSLPEGPFVTLFPDSQFIQQLANVAGIVVQDLGTFDPEADPATYQLSTLTNAIAHGPGDTIVVSAATHLAWTALLSAAATSAGGDLAGDHRFDLEGAQTAAVQWAAKADEVQAFDAIEAQLTPLLVGSNFVSSQSGATYWRAPVGGSALSIAGLVERLTGTLAIVDMGSLDAGAASTIDALLSTAHGIARDAATGELLMSAATRQAVVDALAAELAQARQDLCAEVMQALLASTMRVDGLCALRDTGVVQGLERLGLHDVTRLVLGNQPSFGELGVDGSTLLLSYQTLMQLISRVGSVEAVSATARSEAAALMQALQAIDIDTDIIAVPASTGLSLSDGWLSIRDGGGYVGVELGRLNLLESPIGTVQQGADGTLYMNAATFAALQAELGGLAANGRSSSAATTDSMTYLQDAAQMLSYLEELGTVKSVAPAANDSSTLPAAHVGWWDIFNSWVVETAASETLQQSLGVDGGLLDLAEAFGIDLNANVLTITTREALITALQDGSLKEPYTVVVDAAGNRLISKETRDGLIDALVRSVKSNTGVDWSQLYGSDASAGDPLASALGIGSVDTHSEGLRRSVEQAPDEWRALSTLARSLMSQLQRSHEDAATGRLVYGTNSTSAALTEFNEALVKFSGLKALTLVTPPVNNGSLLHDTFAALGQGVLMTEQTNAALLARARLVATLSDIEASLQVTEGLTGRSGANATVVSWDVRWLDSHSPLPLRELRVTAVDGSVHAISYEKMVAVYGQDRNDSNGVSFGNQPTNYTDPATGQPVAVLNSVVLNAYAQLMNGSTVYALNENGTSAVMAYAAHGAGLGALMQGEQADKSVLVRMLEHAVASAVETVPGRVRVAYEGFKATLEALGLDYFWSTSSSDAGQPSTILDLSDGSFELSSVTRDRVQAQIDTLQSHSTAAVGRALTELAKTAPIYANSDFFRQTSKIDLLNWFATYSAMTKMVVSVRVNPDYLALLKQLQIVEEDPPHIAILGEPLLADQQGLWDTGTIRTATVNDETVLVMTLETQRWLEGKLDTGVAGTMHGLRNVDDAFLDALLAAGVQLDKVTKLRVDNADKTDFLDPVELDQVLDEAPLRTVFVDAHGEHWISGATALALRAELQIALRATSSPVIDLSPSELDARLDAYDAALAKFDGEALVAPANGTSPAVVSFAADLIGSLATLGVNLTQVTSTALLNSTSAFSYVLEGNNATVSAATYASLSTQLPVAGYALQSSLFQNEWTKFSYTGANGSTHVYWQSAEAQESNFVEAISRTKLQLPDAGVLEGTVLDSFTQSTNNTYMTDKFGQVIVSDATYALIQPVLELRALAARTEFASAVDNAQHQAQTHHAEDLVLITDSELIGKIEALALPSKNKTSRIAGLDPDVENLSDTQRDALGKAGAYAVVEGTSHHLLMSAATRDWLASQTSDGIPELKGKGTAVAQVPDVVEITGSAITAYLKDLLGVSLGQLVDDAQQPLPTTAVDGGNLSDSARRQLADVDRLVVLDKDGDLLMSADTWKTLVIAGRQSFAAAGTELTLELTEQLSQALPPVAVQDNHAASQQLRVLQGPYENWLKAFDAVGVSYTMVANAQDVNGHYSTALFDGTARHSVGTDAGGRLVLSDRAFVELSAYVNQLRETYRGTEDSVLATFDPTLPTDLTRFAEADGFASGSTLSHSGAAGRIRDAYTQVTNLRFMLNSGTYTDGTLIGDYWDAVVDQLPQILQTKSVDEVLNVFRSVEGYAQYVPSFHGPRQATQLRGTALEKDINALLPKVDAVIDKIQGGGLSATEVRDLNEQLRGYARELKGDYTNYRTDVRGALTSTNNALNQIGEQPVALQTPAQLRQLVGAVKRQANAGNYNIVKKWFEDVATELRNAMTANENRVDTAVQSVLTNQQGSADLVQAAKADYAARAGKVATELDDFSMQLQMMRAITSYLTWFTSFAGKMHDATLASQMAGSVLGTSESAEAARADYTWRMQKSYINAFQNFASPAQLVVHYVHKDGFVAGLNKFKKHLSKLPHMYKFSKNPFWLDLADDRAPYVNAVKDELTTLGKDAFPDRFTNAWNVHVAQNAIYSVADLAWASTGAAVLYDLYHNRKDNPTHLENARFAVDGLMASWEVITALSWFGGDMTALITNDRVANQRGSRALGWPLHGFLPLNVADSVIATVEYGVSGKGWGAMLDKWVNTILYGIPYFYPQATPWLFAGQLLLRPSFEALENYYAKCDIVTQLAAQGRATEAALMTRQANAELYKIWMVAGWFSWAYNLKQGNATSMSLDEYEQAVRDIYAGRDLPTATDRPADAILALAKQWGAEDNFYVVQGVVVDFPGTTTDQIQVIKAAATWHVENGAMRWHDAHNLHSAAQMSFYDRGVDIEGTENNFYNKAVIEVSASNGVDINNKTGGRAVYLIDEQPLVQVAVSGEWVPGPNIEVDVSKSTADSTNMFIVKNPHAIIKGGASTDVYHLMQEMQTVYDAGQRIAGFISDGAHSPYRDIVSFIYAQATDAAGEKGHFIHSGQGYKGFSYYDGIHNFVGSLYDDVFTRYGSGGESDVWNDYSGAAGKDMFDLRSGNNTVNLSGGTVHFDHVGSASAWTNASNTKEFTEQEKLNAPVGGPFDGSSGYNAIFNNDFTTQNRNVVNVTDGRPGTTFAVYGSAAATDSVMFGQWAGGGLRITSTGQAGDSVVQNLSGTVNHGTFDANVDVVSGTSTADQIVVGANSGLTQVIGGGGADRITVEKSGVTVIAYEGDAIVTLGDLAAGSSVSASDGNTVIIKTDAIGDAPVNVGIVGTPGGSDAWTNPIVVNASDADADLYADMLMGTAHVSLGRDDSTIVINATADSITIVDNDDRHGTIHIKFLDDDGTFETGQLLDGYLEDVAGDSGEYHATWETATGRLVDIEIQYSNSETIQLAAYGGSGLSSLSDLVAGLTPVTPPGG